jgi:Integrase core domain
MRLNSNDNTLKRNYIQKYQFLVEEYEQVKRGEHPTYGKLDDFYTAHGTCRQNFLKYYARYKASNDLASFLPGKRGPKYTTRRTDFNIEQEVLTLREKGCNKYEINSILKPKLLDKTPSHSTIYCIFKRYGVNRKTKQMIYEKRTIYKEKLGELGHIDAYHLPRDTISNDNKRYYLVGVIDSCSRLAWVEVVTDIKALSVMFATLHCINYLNSYYDIKFAEILTDNGAEFGPRVSKNKENHPFERLLQELGIKHRYIRPYRPQTNGKIERFWRTLHEDLIEETYFESIEHFKKELRDYLVYYNHLRPHQSLNGETPKKFAQSCQRIT